VGQTVSFGVAIIGCGVVGRKRAKALGEARLIACADTRSDRAEGLAFGASGVAATDDYQKAIDRPDVDVVVAATTNDRLAEVARFALEHGKHVLVEKPGARSTAELDSVIEAAARVNRLVRVGFNHRYHPGLLKARELVNAGVMGDLMFVRGRYGHGGRIGYETEWRADPVRAGGGELIDQGVHLIDLSRWFLGDFVEVTGSAQTCFWRMPVDDNAFLLLRTPRGRTAFLHVSCTEWKNLFSIEIYGRDGKLHVEGLGGSYGQEKLTYYRMLPAMGPPETTSWEFQHDDRSWGIEFGEFLADIELNRQPVPGLADARAALVIVERIYACSGYDFAKK
jgi:predicted dehydrogenase